MTFNRVKSIPQKKKKILGFILKPDTPFTLHAQYNRHAAVFRPCPWGQLDSSRKLVLYFHIFYTHPPPLLVCSMKVQDKLSQCEIHMEIKIVDLNRLLSKTIHIESGGMAYYVQHAFSIVTIRPL